MASEDKAGGHVSLKATLNGSRGGQAALTAGVVALRWQLAKGGVALLVVQERIHLLKQAGSHAKPAAGTQRRSG